MCSRLAKGLVALTILLTLAQLISFGSKALHQIDYDGISYTQIATEIRLGQFQSSINAFRSPLISWLIALTPALSPLQAGKLLSILTFFSMLVLLYLLTKELWDSQAVAAVAVFLLALARGVSFLAVAFVTPDFLFATIASAYFLVLLRSLRDERRTWWNMGVCHAIAFLVKGIALPWLLMCTCTAALLTNRCRRVTVTRIASALMIPGLVCIAWGAVLQHKYGVFTTGSQFKANLLQWTLKGIVPKQPSTYQVLTDVSSHIDEHMVDDPLPPNAPGWDYHPSPQILASRILRAEVVNLPKAAKELVILLTPGSVLAFLMMCFTFFRSPQYPKAERVFAATVLLGSVALIAAYSMLVIDTRYLFPILPLWLAFASRFLVLQQGQSLGGVRLLCVALVIVGLVFSLAYHASPWRAETRDWQAACYRAGEALRNHHVRTVVSVGSGPYPEHGFGWEAGYKSSYFGQARLVAVAFSVPRDVSSLRADISTVSPDAILVWSADQHDRMSLESALMGRKYPFEETVSDPGLGEVGTILFRDLRAPQTEAAGSDF